MPTKMDHDICFKDQHQLFLPKTGEKLLKIAIIPLAP
jgi:hypothetical protein